MAVLGPSLKPHELEQIARHWLAGGLVALPTETVYGLAADASHSGAIGKIYRAKDRPIDHPLIVHVPDQRCAHYWIDLEQHVRTGHRFERLAERFWPGPLTMIVPRHPQAPAYACGGQRSVGLRAPSHPVAQQMLGTFAAAGGKGIAAPSANRFGRISPTALSHVQQEFPNIADLLLVDGGQASVGLESTIVDLTRDQPVLLRPGAITLADLTAALGEPVHQSANVSDPSTVDASAPRASGTLASHYAPVTPLVMVEGENLQARRQLEIAKGRRVVVLACDLPAPEYARALYSRLREADLAGADLILAQWPPRKPEWAATLDRLSRAQTREP